MTNINYTILKFIKRLVNKKKIIKKYKILYIYKNLYR